MRESVILPFLYTAAFLVSEVETLAAESLRAGIAVRVVTPRPLLPISGGVGPSALAGETRGELTVRALVFEKGKIRVAMVSTDFLGFPAILGDRARAKVPEIPPENILIGATHTHSAPDLYGFPDEKGSTAFDARYAETVIEAVAAVIREGLRQLQPVELRIATGEARGKIAYNYYAPDLYDPRVSVVQAIANGGKPLATLVNYAIHPEVLGNDQGILSPDLVGPLVERIEEKGGGTGIFLNGAQGGMVTADNRDPAGGEDIRTWEECRRIGRLLADEALRIVERTPVLVDPELLVRSRIVEFPVDSPLLRRVMEASPLGYATDEKGRVATRVSLVTLGNARILTIPGEALPNIGYYLKRKMGAEHALLFGLTNDAFGYILTAVDWQSFQRYEYISRTSLGERTGEIFVAEALKLVAEADAR